MGDGEGSGNGGAEHGKNRAEAGRGGDRHKRFRGGAKLQHGSRAKRGDMGRSDWSRSRNDRRTMSEESAAKRQKTAADGDAKPSLLSPAFSQEEIAAEERKPKHKVAVLVGYSGSGYKGMQINASEKTIEGDLFAAFVAAGAISKANANDPKKSALVRCARTDKGVHAAGNVISLKLIVEDPDIVAKINEALSPQIRVWGILRTTGSFSCYQACDSRWYEYLIPTHSFLPPHPSSYLGKRLEELADEVGDREGYDERQKEVADFWSELEEKHIKPILDTLPEKVRAEVHQALYEFETAVNKTTKEEPAAEEQSSNTDDVQQASAPTAATHPATTAGEDAHPADPTHPTSTTSDSTSVPHGPAPPEVVSHRRALDAAVRALRAAYITAKKAHRIHPARLARVEASLTHFLGTQNFHNYTVAKSHSDPSAKRVIRSFALAPKPILIAGTEWLSLKIHGQSFMMHQIRKMVGMLALCVRCGTSLARIRESFGDVRVVIPKAPGLGLLLERPVFDSYNDGAATKFDKERIDFGRFEDEIEAFKQREIYERIFREEEAGNAFHSFFAHVDSLREDEFLWLSSKGVDAVQQGGRKSSGRSKVEVDSEDEGAGGKEEG